MTNMFHLSSLYVSSRLHQCGYTHWVYTFLSYTPFPFALLAYVWLSALNMEGEGRNEDDGAM